MSLSQQRQINEISEKLEEQARSIEKIQRELANTGQILDEILTREEKQQKNNKKKTA